MEWISVSDRLPQDGQTVLLYDNEEQHVATFKEVCTWCKKKKGFVYDPEGEWHGKHWHLHKEFDRPPTHWMPLPTPPKDE